MSEAQNFPRVGISIIVIRENKVLLGKRKGSFSHGTWQFPGGALKHFESFEDCVKREIREEVGIKVKNIKLLTAINNIIEKEKIHFVSIVMTCEYVSGEPKALEEKYCEGWQWFEWDKLPEPLFEPVENLKKLRIDPLSLNKKDQFQLYDK